MHPEIVFECFACKITFDLHYDLRQHMLDDRHTLSENVSDHEWKISQKVEKNIRNEKKIKQYKCAMCSQQFSNPSSLKIHENVHTCKRYICDVCGNSFSEKYRLMEHQQSHTDEREFKCTHQDCQKAFKRKRDLQDHLKIHEGKKGK